MSNDAIWLTQVLYFLAKLLVNPHVLHKISASSKLLLMLLLLLLLLGILSEKHTRPLPVFVYLENMTSYMNVRTINVCQLYRGSVCAYIIIILMCIYRYYS